MSALIVKKTGPGTYVIIRQSPVLSVKASSADRNIVCRYKKLRAEVYAYPAFCEDDRILYLRGSDKDLDDKEIYVPELWDKEFRGLVMKINKEYSNNSQIDPEAVILE